MQNRSQLSGLGRLLLAGMVILLSIGWWPSRVSAQWEVYKKARIVNNEGHRLRFDTWDGRRIRLWLIAGQAHKSVFADESIAYRVDDHIVHRIEKGDAQMEIAVKPGNWLSFLISVGGAPSAQLSEFLNGESVVFQYYGSAGKVMETEFSLNGAAPAILELME